MALAIECSGESQHTFYDAPHQQHWRSACFSTPRPPHPARARLSRDRVVAQQDKSHDEGFACGAKGKYAIAWLQEFVQGSKECKLPGNCPVIQWSFEQRLNECKNMEFRATVRFWLDKVPHHAAGTWQSCKKTAMRDAAERALRLFVTRWGEVVDTEVPSHIEGLALTPPLEKPIEQQHADNNEAARVAATLDIVQELVRNWQSSASCGQTPIALETGQPQWSHKQDDHGFVAFVEVELLGVAHMFAGPSRNCLAEACEDTARRVLWYLQCPGFADDFEPDIDMDVVKDVPEAPKGWLRKDASENEAKEEAEEKTVVMRLQNRLQQAYSKKILPKTSAINWNYERRNSMVCATAYIPAVGKEFSSEWKKGQKDAQIDACKNVFKYLDENPPEQGQGGRSRNGSG